MIVTFKICYKYYERYFSSEKKKKMMMVDIDESKKKQTNIFWMTFKCDGILIFKKYCISDFEIL